MLSKRANKQIYKQIIYNVIILKVTGTYYVNTFQANIVAYVLYKSYPHISGKICSCAILQGNFDICGLKIKLVCIYTVYICG